MTREEATNIANLVYRIEETEELIDKFNMIYNETDNQELIKCLDEGKNIILLHKEKCERELSNYNVSYND